MEWLRGHIEWSASVFQNRSADEWKQSHQKMLKNMKKDRRKSGAR